MYWESFLNVNPWPRGLFFSREPHLHMERYHDGIRCLAALGDDCADRSYSLSKRDSGSSMTIDLCSSYTLLAYSSAVMHSKLLTNSTRLVTKR